MKQRIRLNESQFNRLVKETVKRVLKESVEPGNGAPYYLYVNYDCVEEYDDYLLFKKEADVYHIKYPDAVIDINDNTDEYSVYGFN